MQILLTEEDYRDIRSSMMGVLSFVLSDEHIVRAVDSNIASSALMWGWGDTEVRDMLAYALEATR